MNGFRAEFKDFFMVEFIAVNDSLEGCEKKKKTKTKQKLKFLD